MSLIVLDAPAIATRMRLNPSRVVKGEAPAALGAGVPVVLVSISNPLFPGRRSRRDAAEPLRAKSGFYPGRPPAAAGLMGRLRCNRGAPAASWRPMKVLYIGGTGEISQACVQASVALGHDLSLIHISEPTRPY